MSTTPSSNQTHRQGPRTVWDAVRIRPTIRSVVSLLLVLLFWVASVGDWQSFVPKAPSSSMAVALLFLWWACREPSVQQRKFHLLRAALAFLEKVLLVLICVIAGAIVDSRVFGRASQTSAMLFAAVILLLLRWGVAAGERSLRERSSIAVAAADENLASTREAAPAMPNQPNTWFRWGIWSSMALVMAVGAVKGGLFAPPRPPAAQANLQAALHAFNAELLKPPPKKGFIQPTLIGTTGYGAERVTADGIEFTREWTPLRPLEGGPGALLDTKGAGISWLDNSHLLVVADMPALDPNSWAGPRNVTKAIWVWDANTHKTEKYRDLPPGLNSGMCAANGNVWYQTDENPQQNFADYWVGRFGSETMTHAKLWTGRYIYRDSDMPGGTFVNRLDCAMQSRDETARPEHHYGVVLRFLRKQDGYLAVTKDPDGLYHNYPHQSEDDSIQLISPDGSPPKTVGITVKEIYTAHVLYSGLTGEYTIVPTSPPNSVAKGSSWPENSAHIVYFLKRDGSLRHQTFPSDVRDATGYVTRAGYLVTGASFGTADLYRDGNRIQIESSVITDANVSPDGCKVAMSLFDNNLMADRIRVIDFCPSGS